MYKRWLSSALRESLSQVMLSKWRSDNNLLCIVSKITTNNVHWMDDSAAVAVEIVVNRLAMKWQVLDQHILGSNWTATKLQFNLIIQVVEVCKLHICRTTISVAKGIKQLSFHGLHVHVQLSIYPSMADRNSSRSCFFKLVSPAGCGWGLDETFIMNV